MMKNDDLLICTTVRLRSTFDGGGLVGPHAGRTSYLTFWYSKPTSPKIKLGYEMTDTPLGFYTEVVHDPSSS